MLLKMENGVVLHCSKSYTITPFHNDVCLYPNCYEVIGFGFRVSPSLLSV